MVKTIFQTLSVVAKSNLDRATPPKWPIIEALYKIHEMYAITITYKSNHSITVEKIKMPTFKHEGTIGMKTLYDHNIVIKKQERSNQIKLTAEELTTSFEGMEFILYPEFTKNGMIHWHGLMYHPLIQACGVVEDSIIKVCRRFGKQHDVKKVNDIEAWFKYITKEGRAPLSTPAFQSLPRAIA